MPRFARNDDLVIARSAATKQSSAAFLIKLTHNIAVISTRDPIHPGEQLREEFMKPLGITAYRLAKDIGVPVTRIQAIVAERRSITEDTALRLGRYFGTSAEFWLDMQRDYELQTAAEALGTRLETEVKPRTA